jgi:hypothetical protein
MVGADKCRCHRRQAHFGVVYIGCVLHGRQRQRLRIRLERHVMDRADMVDHHTYRRRRRRPHLGLLPLDIVVRRRGWGRKRPDVGRRNVVSTRFRRSSQRRPDIGLVLLHLVLRCGGCQWSRRPLGRQGMVGAGLR